MPHLVPIPLFVAKRLVGDILENNLILNLILNLRLVGDILENPRHSLPPPSLPFLAHFCSPFDLDLDLDLDLEYVSEVDS